jgi:hypothetical protein
MKRPSFSFENPWIRFDLAGCHDLLSHSISRTCEIHKVPKSIASLRGLDPWNTIELIDGACEEEGVNLSLNETTIIGNSISDGAKGKFWQKVLPQLFEDVVGLRWPALERADGRVADWTLNGVKIDCKCKHRNVPPFRNSDYIATVPESQSKMPVDYYCFGQIANQCTHGFILGVMSKRDFASKCHTKEKGDVDWNGERYVDPVNAVFLHQLPHWQGNTVDGFYPLKYLLERSKWTE